MALYMISARKDLTSGDPGPLQYLRSGDGGATYATLDVAKWSEAILGEFQKDARGRLVGDLLLFVHGFNVSYESARAATQAHHKALTDAGWAGVLIGFDWASEGITFEYLQDRHNARLTASHLVSGGIALLERLQSRTCCVSVHVLCHSMGAFVVREAFTWAYQDVPSNWTVGQLLFVAADIGAPSLSTGTEAAQAFERHVGRITAYTNKYDKTLAVSDAKRIDVDERLGRVGLPDDAPPIMSGVDCSALYEAVDPGLVKQFDPLTTHGFYFSQPVFWQDVVLTLGGGTDRNVIPTRTPLDPPPKNRFSLITTPLQSDAYETALHHADMGR